MVTVIDNLERRGLAEKRLPHPDDRHAVAVTLSAKARQLLLDLDEQGPTRSKTRSARHCRTASATPSRDLLQRVAAGAGLIPGVHPQLA